MKVDHVFPRKQSKNYAEQQNISRSYLDYLPLFYKTAPKLLSEYDIIHANNGKTAPAALSQIHRPVVLTLWGTDLLGQYGPIVKKSAKYCDAVIVRSAEMEEELSQDAHVIPAGVNLSLFKPADKRDALEHIGWEKNKKHVLFPYDPSYELKRYPLAKSVVEKVNRSIRKSVEMKVVTGVSHDQMPQYLNAADALLMTSEQEGSPNTIKEAMACNTPIVSTDVGDVRERLDGVSNSKVCQDEENLATALESILSTNARSNGRKYIQDISLEQTSQQIIEIYEQVCE